MSAFPNTDLINFKSEGCARIIELNRPKSLNSLNFEMVQAMLTALKIWQDSESCSLVIIKSSSTATPARKIFCAGGDVVTIAKLRGRPEEQIPFFKFEYALNHLIGTYKKPIVSFIDGITMGGGVGLTVHGRFRIATENTVFAMPEAAIGFFPDVGGSFFLPRLDSALGMYLGLTGRRISGIDVYHSRIATHYIPSARLEHVQSSLSAQPLSSDTINRMLENFTAEYEPPSFFNLLPAIEECFGIDNLHEIQRRLECASKANDPQISQWAQGVLQEISLLSPTSLLVTVELLRRGRHNSFRNCLRLEYNLTKRYGVQGASCLANVVCSELDVSDFYAGVESKLINKSGTPKWNPPSILEARPEMIPELFKPSSTTDEPAFASADDYNVNPFASYALPTKAAVKQYLLDIGSNCKSRQEFMSAVLKDLDWKMGLAPLLQQICASHVKTREEAGLHTTVAGPTLVWKE